MFFKKVKQEQQPRIETVAWDEKMLEHFNKSDRFDVHLTSVTRRRGFGRTDRIEIREPVEYEFSGVMTFPKLVLVSINLDNSESESDLGVWYYTKYIEGDRAYKRDMPYIEIWLGDRDGRLAEAMLDSHRAALTSGKKRSLVRFWKNRDEGAFTAKDREHGYSYESRFPILGMYTWEEYESAQLPNWAVPFAHERFSTEGTEEWFNLKL